MELDFGPPPAKGPKDRVKLPPDLRLTPPLPPGTRRVRMVYLIANVLTWLGVLGAIGFGAAMIFGSFGPNAPAGGEWVAAGCVVSSGVALVSSVTTVVSGIWCWRRGVECAGLVGQIGFLALVLVWLLHVLWNNL